MIRLALRNLARSWTQYLPVVIFFALGWALILVVQGALNGADRNLQAVYPNSLTGDLVVRPSLKPAWTLFGSEGSLWEDSSLPPLLDHGAEVETLIRSHGQVIAVAGVLAGPVLIDQEGVHHKAWVFGVDPPQYWAVVSRLARTGDRTLGSAAWLSHDLAQELKTPETIRLLYSAGQDFRIVRAPVVGTLDYQIPVTIVEHLMVLDVRSAGHLFGDRSSEGAADPRNMDLMRIDPSRLFSTTSDVESPSSADPLSLLAAPASPHLGKSVTPLWNFFLLSLRQGTHVDQVAQSLNREFSLRHWNLEAVGWRTAAGGSALYVQWLQGLLAAGLSLLFLTGAGSLINAMTGIVVERSREIGTMRALGASRFAVFGLLGTEALLVTTISASGAWTLATVADWCLERVPIANAVLGLLFGSRGVRVVPDPWILSGEALLMAVLALVGTWGPLRALLRQGIAGTLEERPS